jgi:DNA-binding XRE family transcriptional regulator
MRDLTDSGVRVELGISRVAAAKLAGVTRNTIALYEAKPDAVKTARAREACASVYRLLRDLLKRMPARKAA